MKENGIDDQYTLFESFTKQIGGSWDNGIELASLKHQLNTYNDAAFIELSREIDERLEQLNDPQYRVRNHSKDTASPVSSVKQDTPPKDFSFNSLEAMRKRLLDLSGRNRLLNFRHGKKDSLRVIDELPDQLQSLLINEQVMRFKAIPEPSRDELFESGYLRNDEKTGEEVRVKADPSAREWAKQLGFEINYELPQLSEVNGTDSKHQDRDIQTLLFPYEMESILRNISA